MSLVNIHSTFSCSHLQKHTHIHPHTLSTSCVPHLPIGRRSLQGSCLPRLHRTKYITFNTKPPSRPLVCIGSVTRSDIQNPLRSKMNSLCYPLKEERNEIARSLDRIFLFFCNYNSLSCLEEDVTLELSLVSQVLRLDHPGMILLLDDATAP